jgi:hypothetical protein
MSEQYRVNHQRVSSVKDSTKTKVVGIENNLTNYSAFIPPEPNSPEGMYCPRESCRRWVYRDNKECEYCKYDIQAYWYRIDLQHRKAFSIRGFFKRIVLDLVVWLPFILLNFTSSLLIGVLFIVGLLALAVAGSARFQE